MDSNTTKFKKVMIVDDAELDRFVVKKVLTRNNFAKEVVAAESAMDALEYLRANIGEDFPELIFLDINMPEMNGFDFLEEYDKLETKKQCIIVMLSSSLHPEDHERAESNPYVCKFMNKPLTPDKLVEVDVCM